MKYEDYLLTQFNICKEDLGFDNYELKVVEERSFRMPKEHNKIVFVTKRLTGSYVLGIRTQPVQIICYSETETFNVAMQILDLFAKKFNNSSFYDDNSVLIKQNYDTPVTLKTMVLVNIKYRASLYLYGVYTECENLSDLKNLKWYNADSTKQDKYEDVNFITASIGYGAVMNTTKDRGFKVSTSLVQEAGLTVTITMMNDNSNFVKKVDEIMLGTVSSNYDIKLSFELNGVAYTDKLFRVETVGFVTNRTDAPSLSITLRM